MSQKQRDTRGYTTCLTNLTSLNQPAAVCTEICSVLFLQVPLYLDTRLAAHPQPKPRRSHLISADQSIMEMQRTYPDLAFRGRPLVPDKPHQPNSSRNSSKDVQTAGDDSKGAELHKRDSVKGTRAAALTVCSKNSGSKADEAFGDNTRSCNDRNSGGTTLPGNTTSSSTDGGGVNELSGPQAISLHITLRTQPTAEPLGWTQHQATAGNTHTDVLSCLGK